MRNLLLPIAFIFMGNFLFAQTPFSRLIGDNQENRIDRTLIFNENYYILGQRNGMATVTRMDFTGTIIWTRTLNNASKWNDIIVMNNDFLLLVGSFGANDETLIGVLDPGAGIFTTLHRYDLNPGLRDGLLNVIMHPNPNPLAPNFRYYATGFETTSGTRDRTIMVTIDNTGSIGRKYSYFQPFDSQFERSIDFDANTNELIICGNDYDNSSTDFRGVTVTINNAGTAIRGRQFNEPNFFQTILRNIDAGGNVSHILGGHNTNTNEAQIVKVEGNLIRYAYDIPQMTTVVELIPFGAAVGFQEYIALGRGIDVSSGLQKVIYTHIRDNGGSATVLSSGIFDGSDAHSNGYGTIVPTIPPNPPRYLFTDTRSNPTGFGNLDGYIIVTDMTLMNCLFVRFDITLTDKLPGLDFTTFTPTNTETAAIPTPVDVMEGDVTLTTRELCNCTVDFTSQTTNCGIVNFTSQTNLTGAVTYVWTFGNSPLTTSALQNPTHTYVTNATYNVCLTVSNGVSSCNICKNVVVTNADNTGPVIDCPNNIQISNTPGQCYANVTPQISVTDNCDPSPTCNCIMTGATSGVMPKNTNVQFNVGLTTVSCTAHDASGFNATPCVFTVTVFDAELPKINCPPNLTISCSSDPYNLSVTGTATATDNCPGVVISYSDVVTGTSCNRIYTRTWIAIDASGSMRSCIQKISVIDDVAPVITCPPNLTISCIDNTDPSQTGFATATDNCQSTPAITYNDVISGSGCIKTITRTWRAKDGCNNESTCFQIIQVEDLIPPTFTCPPSNVIPIECTSNQNYGVPTNVMDNCTGSISKTNSDVTIVDGCFTTINRTWTVTDLCGNSATCLQVIKIQDTRPPVITGCGRKITVQGTRNGSGLCEANVTVISPVGIDDCSSVLLTNDYNNTSNASDTYPSGQTIITWTAKDACGLMSMCMDTIVVLPCPDCCWDEAGFDLIAATAPIIQRENCEVQLTFSGLTSCQRIIIDWGDGQSTGYVTNPTIINHDYILSGDYQACVTYEEIDAEGNKCFEETKCYDICVTCEEECQNEIMVNKCYTSLGKTSTEDRYAVNKFDMIQVGNRYYTVSGLLNGSGNMDAAVFEMDENCSIIRNMVYGGDGDEVASIIKHDPYNNQFIISGVYKTVSWPITNSSGGIIATLTNDGVEFNGFVMAVDAAFNPIWAFSIGAQYRDFINDFDIDNLGNIYIVGSARGLVNFNPLGAPEQVNLDYSSGFVAKYDPTGMYIWHDVIVPDDDAGVSCSAISVNYPDIYVGGGIAVNSSNALSATITLSTCSPFIITVIPPPTSTTTPVTTGFSNFVLHMIGGGPTPTRICHDQVTPVSNVENAISDIIYDNGYVYVAGSQVFAKYDAANISIFTKYPLNYQLDNMDITNAYIYLAGTNPVPAATVDFITGTYGINTNNWEMITTILNKSDLSFKKSMVLPGSGLDYNFGIKAIPGGDFYIHGITRSIDLKYDPQTNALFPLIPSPSESTIFIGRYGCECIDETDCCEETSASLSGTDVCCKSLDIINNADFQVTQISVEVITPGWSMSSASAGPGYTLSLSGSQYIITHTTGNIPMGNVNALFDFCLQGLSGSLSSQEIVVHWYETTISGNVVIACSDTIQMNCNPPPPQMPCLEFNPISIICDPLDDNIHIVEFTITNLSSDIDATSVYLSGLPPGYYFRECGGSSFVSAVNIPIIPSIGEGESSMTLCFEIYSVDPILTPIDVCFSAGLHGLDGLIFSCCSEVEPICVTLLPCCDPCEDISFTTTPLNELEGGCCFSLQMNNECQYDVFKRLEMNILTSDVHFGYLNPGSGWNYCNTPGLQNICIEPASGSFNIGTSIPVVQFCLANINDPSQIPQDLEIILYSDDGAGMEIVACEKNIMVDCDIPPNENCLIVTNTTAYCDPENGKYLVSVTIENNSNPDFCANEILITPLDPGTVMPSVVVLSDFLCYGESTTINFMLNSLPFPDADGMFRVIFSLKNNLTEECCQGGLAHIETIQLPECPCTTTCCSEPAEHHFEDYALGNLPNNQVGWVKSTGIPTIVTGGASGSGQSVILPALTRGTMPSSVEYRHAGVAGPDLILPANELICLHFWAKLNPLATLPVNGRLSIQFDHVTIQTITIPYTNAAWTQYELCVITPPSGVYTLQFVNHSAAPLDYGPSIQIDDICFEEKVQIFDDETPPVISCPDDITLHDTDVDCIVNYAIPNLSITDPSGVALVEYYLDGVSARIMH